jgi:AAA domain
MLSSQTHVALDNVLEQVAELDPSLDMIRIGQPDDARISDPSKKLLLNRRVEAWIAEVRLAAEAEMKHWADENGVDRDAVAVGVKVKRLLQVLARQSEMRKVISRLQAERAGVENAGPEAIAGPADQGEVDEETTQIDSELGACRQALKLMLAAEAKLRAEMLAMGAFAADLSRCEDLDELAEWAKHFLTDEPTITACRERWALLEDWQLRVGRSSDFNAAMLASAQIIAGTCVGIASVKGMEDVGYELCIVDEASKATATEILIPMSRSRRWIIVGDPKQLPPFFEEFGEQIQSEFDDDEVRATLLDRLLDERNGVPASCRAALQNQYRMIRPIGNLVSHCFYEGKLKSPVNSHGLKLTAALPKPVTWYSTHQLPQRSEQPEGQTFRNTAEVAAVKQVLLRLQFVAKAQERRISVAVIAGYTAQVRMLREMASRSVAEWPDLDVACNSVDAFQGRQADICIYSVVRSNTRAQLGFLRERPRLNVALSPRQKRSRDGGRPLFLPRRARRESV